MEHYPSNSHKSKEAIVNTDKKKVEKVVSGKAKIKKKSDAKKFADIFVSEDVDNVKSYVIMDVLIPAVKKAVSDIVVNGIDMLLYGESRGPRKNSNASYVSYSNYYNRDRFDDRRDRTSIRQRNNYNYNDIILDNRGDAEEVLSRMDEIISQYEIVSIADLNDLVGITGNYTDNNYGWTDISSASVQRVRDGYLIKLPRALPIK